MQLTICDTPATITDDGTTVTITIAGETAEIPREAYLSALEWGGDKARRVMHDIVFDALADAGVIVQDAYGDWATADDHERQEYEANEDAERRAYARSRL